MSKKETNKEIVEKKEAPAPAVMSSTSVDPDDVLISRIKLMQALSPEVVDGQATIGEFRDSVTGELLGKASEPMEIIIFNHFKTWIVKERPAGEKKYQFKSIEPYTMENKGLAWNETLEDGTDVKRTKTYNFHCVVANATMETDLYRTFSIGGNKYNVNTAKKILTTIFKIEAIRSELETQVFTMSAKQEKNEDDQPFQCWVATPSRLSEKKEREVAANWKRLSEQFGYKEAPPVEDQEDSEPVEVVAKVDVTNPGDETVNF